MHKKSQNILRIAQKKTKYSSDCTKKTKYSSDCTNKRQNILLIAQTKTKYSSDCTDKKDKIFFWLHKIKNRKIRMWSSSNQIIRKKYIFTFLSYKNKIIVYAFLRILGIQMEIHFVKKKTGCFPTKDMQSANPLLSSPQKWPPRHIRCAMS